MIYAYPESDHEAELVRFFGGYDRIVADMRNASLSENSSAAGKQPDIVICFSNRSGSNLVVDGLKKFGNLADAGEYFNFDVVIDFCSLENITTLSGYFFALRAHVLEGKSGPFCTKLGSGQLYFLSKIGFVERFLSGARFVRTRRVDLLEQAVSFSIADQTGRWTSEHAGESDEVHFNPEDINYRLNGILEANFYLDRYFALTGRPCYEVVYEELEKDFCSRMRGLMRWVEMPELRTPAISDVTLKRQRDSRNAEFVAKVRGTYVKA